MTLLCFKASKLWSRYSYWNRKSTQAFHIKILKRLEPFDKERISVHKLYNTANQNNSVIFIFWGWKQNLLLLNMIVSKDCQSSLIRSNSFNSVIIKLYTFTFIFHIEAWHMAFINVENWFKINLYIIEANCAWLGFVFKFFICLFVFVCSYLML